MLAKTHLLISSAATLFVFHQEPSIPQWVAVFLGTLAPDIDHASSFSSQPASKLPLPPLVKKILNKITRGLTAFIRVFCGHRQCTHWPSLALSLALLGILLELNFLLWFSWGYLLHIMADACTKGGVPLFGPVWRKKISLAPILTGSMSEMFIASGCCLLILCQMFSLVTDGEGEFISRLLGFEDKMARQSLLQLQHSLLQLWDTLTK